MVLANKAAAAPPMTKDIAGLPRLRLGTLLFGLVLAALIPALLIGYLAVWKAVEGRQEAAEGRLGDTAQALSLALNSEIGRYVTLASVLASSNALDGSAPDLRRFDAEARRLAERMSTAVALVEVATNAMPVNTALPVGDASRLTAVTDYREAIVSRRPLITDLVLGVVLRSLRRAADGLDSRQVRQQSGTARRRRWLGPACRVRRSSEAAPSSPSP